MSTRLSSRRTTATGSSASSRHSKHTARTAPSSQLKDSHTLSSYAHTRASYPRSYTAHSHAPSYHDHRTTTAAAAEADAQRHTQAISKLRYSPSTRTSYRTSQRASPRPRGRRVSITERLRSMYRDFAIEGIVLIELDSDLPQMVRSLCFPNVSIYLIPDDQFAEARSIAEFHGLYPSAEFSLSSKPPMGPQDRPNNVLQYTTNHVKTPNLEAGRLFLVPLSLTDISEDMALPSVPADANIQHVCTTLKVPLRHARIVLAKIILRFVRYQRSQRRKEYSEMLYKCVVCAVSYVVFPKNRMATQNLEMEKMRARLTVN
ncbi:hypothetical protein BROUX41_004937 [Berkeleyomyces rouxiae]|uniref:uncharacterized protein n=1 Tax=Berkeleyomyces rouxiae TaxID=2035830 RepID=UPI003B7D1AED